MMVESKLLIIPAIKSLSWTRKFGYKKPLGNSSIKYGVKVKNIDNKPFGGAKIKRIMIYPAGISGSPTAYLTSDKEFEIKKLNPEEETLIWFENAFIPFSGLLFLKFELESKEKIITCQWDRGNKTPSLGKENVWEDLFMVADENILQQKITNVLLIILTIFIFLISVF